MDALELETRCPIQECRALWYVRQAPRRARPGYLCTGCGRSFELRLARPPQGVGSPPTSPWVLDIRLEHTALTFTHPFYTPRHGRR